MQLPQVAQNLNTLALIEKPSSFGLVISMSKTMYQSKVVGVHLLTYKIWNKIQNNIE